MDKKFTIQVLSDKYVEEMKSKSIAPNQTYGEIMVNPSSCVMPLPFSKYLEIIRNFKVFDDDVWIVTFPKCGTTWTQEMVWLLKNNLDYESAKRIILKNRVPFLELETIFSKYERDDKASRGTIELAKNLPRPRCIKSHLPVELLPKELWTVKPKIIYVTRDPRDSAISYYHHCRLWHGYQGTLHDFIDVFLNDRVVYAPYWSHVLGFMDLEDKSHVLFNSYEEMKKDLGNVIKKTARFLGVDLNEEQLEALKDHLSFSKMRENKSVNQQELGSIVKKETKADVEDENLNFIRKGEAGGWKNIFDDDVLDKFKEWNERNLRGRPFKEYQWS